MKCTRCKTYCGSSWWPKAVCWWRRKQVRPKKFLTALFYSVQTPFGVWAGIEFSEGQMLLGWGLIAVMMLLECIAVYYWMDAQADQTIEGIEKRKKKQTS